jgi:hypothetical protein
MKTVCLGLILLVALSWMPSSTSLALRGGAAVADDAGMVATVDSTTTTANTPRAQLDWVVKVLQRDPLVYHEGELAAHLSPLAGHEGILEEVQHRTSTQLSLSYFVVEAGRTIKAVLVDDESDLVVQVQLQVGPWWFPYVAAMSFTEKQSGGGEGWGMTWCMFACGWM